MEIICETYSHFSPLSSNRRAVCNSSFFGPSRRYVWRSMRLRDDISTALYTGFQSHVFGPQLMSARYDESVMTCKGMCSISWSVEAEIEDDCIIFLTGDPLSLGQWDPQLAIPLSLSTRSTNLWETEIMVPYGIHFKYNYFIRKENNLSPVVIWRPGPEYSLSVPLSNGEDREIRVRDSWLKTIVSRLPVPSWGSWIIESFFMKKEHTISLGEHDILTSQNGKIPKKSGDPPCIDISASSAPENTENNYYINNLEGERKSQERDQPVEEPWLIQSTLFRTYKEKEKEKDEKSSIIKNEDKVGSTVILVNSSVCTMQRIAVLEEGKLVELLLEPVKNKVQCDSIYLGSITRLVPHMGGAFVDIGLKRSSLMDIMRYRKPFVYPFGDMDDNYNYNDNDNNTEEECEESGNNNGGEMEGESENLEGEGETESVEEEFGEDADVALPVQPQNGKRKKRNQWVNVDKGTKIIVQVVKEGLGSKGPNLTPYPKLRSRFWVLKTRCDTVGVSKKITAEERTRLKVIAKILKPEGFGLTVRTVAAGHTLVELQKDLEGLLSTWREIVEHAKSAALADQEGVEGAVPVMLHRAMGQTLSVVQDYFNDKVKSMVVDSPRTYHEVTRYLQDIAPELCGRVQLYEKRTPIFDEYQIEDDINAILSKRVVLPNGGSLVIEQTEALVSIDVNSGSSVAQEGTSKEKAALDCNLLAAKQIARELRLRDIGGIIAVDFIDMTDEANKRLVYEEMTKAVKQDRSNVRVYELSNLGLMEISRKRVRPSVSFMISDPCINCQATGRVEALEMSFLKIENQIRRLLDVSNQKRDPENPETWARFGLKVDEQMYNYLISGKNTKLAVLSVSLNVRISLKVVSGFSRGQFDLRQIPDAKKNGEEQKQELVVINSNSSPPVVANTEPKTKNRSPNFLINFLKKRGK